MNALATPCELSVIIPTYNEALNVRPLVEALAPVLAGIGLRNPFCR